MKGAKRAERFRMYRIGENLQVQHKSLGHSAYLVYIMRSCRHIPGGVHATAIATTAFGLKHCLNAQLCLPLLFVVVVIPSDSARLTQACSAVAAGPAVVSSCNCVQRHSHHAHQPSHSVCQEAQMFDADHFLENAETAHLDANFACPDAASTLTIAVAAAKAA